MTAGRRKVRVVGPGRAGRALATALEQVGWEVAGFVGRHDDKAGAAAGVDLLVIATPDAAIAPVAAEVQPHPATVVMHLAGSLGADVLGRHPERAALHPLVALPDPVVGAERLRSGAWFAVAGHRLAAEVVASLGGRAIEVADADRAAYHAAACIASNHLVALLGQVERVAATAGIPVEAYLHLCRGTLDNVAALGPRGAITGPAARGDRATLDRHRAALASLGPDEVGAYDALVALVERLVAGAPAPVPPASDRDGG